MKETGINKLVELLNEYESAKATRDYTWRIEKQNETRICGTEYTGAYVDDEEAERIIISKKYKFIEWLVKNNKIDHDKVYDNENYYAVDVWDNTDELLMLLAISENPISDLIYILK